MLRVVLLVQALLYCEGFSSTLKSGSFDIQWVVQGTTLQLSFISKQPNQYVSLGFTDSDMATGTYIIMYGANVIYDAYTRGSKTLPTRSASQITNVTSTSQSGSTVTVTMVRPLSSVQTKFQMWAVGAWVSGQPAQHERGNFELVTINFLTGEIKTARKELFIHFIICPVVIFLMAIFTFVMKRFAPKSFLFHTTVMGMSIGKILFIFIMVLTIIFFFGVSFVNVKGTSPDVIRAFGSVACYLLTLILLPIHRSSILRFLFSGALERSAVYHIAVALLLVLATTIHGVGMIAEGGLNGETPFEFPSPTMTTISVLPGLISYIILIIVTFAAITRRRSWELFYFTHFLTFLIVLFAILHFPPLIYGMILALLLGIIDWIYRLMSTTKRSVIVFTERVGDCLYIQVRSNAVRHWEPGQYAFLTFTGVHRVPHPFSMCNWVPKGANGSTESDIFFMIKNMGDDSHTGKITLTTSVDTPITLEGPYGCLTFNLKLYEHVMLIAGGVGITPALSILHALGGGYSPTCKKVTLIWTSRDEELFEYFDDFIVRNGERIETFNYYPYCSSTSVGTLPFVQKGRPSWIDQLSLDDVNPVALFCCGPIAMVNEVKSTTSRVQVRFHTHYEQFEL